MASPELSRNFARAFIILIGVGMTVVFFMRN